MEEEDGGVAYSVEAISTQIRGDSPEECKLALKAHRLYMSGGARDPFSAIDMAKAQVTKVRDRKLKT